MLICEFFLNLSSPTETERQLVSAVLRRWSWRNFKTTLLATFIRPQNIYARNESNDDLSSDHIGGHHRPFNDLGHAGIRLWKPMRTTTPNNTKMTAPKTE
jgi:hypothetical protein